MDAELVYGRALQLRHRAGHFVGLASGQGPASGEGRGYEAGAFRALRRSFGRAPYPELEGVLAARGREDTAPTLAVLRRCGDALQAVARLRFVVIDACAIDPGGSCFVAASLPSTTHVARAGDVLLSGAYAYADGAGGGVIVGARFVRPGRWSAFALPGRRVGPDEDVSRVLRRGAARRVREIVQVLEGGRWIPVEHPVAALATLGVHVPARDRVALREAYRRRRDRTLHGAVAALADLARAQQDVARRYALERQAGDALLACVPLAETRSELAGGGSFVVEDYSGVSSGSGAGT